MKRLAAVAAIALALGLLAGAARAAEDLVIAKREPAQPRFEAIADAVTEEILRI